MKVRFVLCFAVFLFFANSGFAQQHEFGVTVGSAQPEDVRTDAGVANVKGSFALQFDYSGRIFNAGIIAVYGNTPFAIATKNTLEVLPTVSLATREYRSYYFTPGFKVKIVPDLRVSPYVVGGFGFARLVPRDRAANQALDIFDRIKEFSPAYSFGGGVDVRVKRNIALRGEVRSYNTKPFDLESFGVDIPGVDFEFLGERQRNIFFTGGVVFRL